MPRSGKARILGAGFKAEDNSENGSPTFFNFEQLSDGQRIIIVLYTLLHTRRSIFLDEPENYLALQEIQPWLQEFYDSVGEALPQALLISHHPEVINYLDLKDCLWMERAATGPARIQKIPEDTEDTNEKALRLSELIARRLIGKEKKE